MKSQIVAKARQKLSEYLNLRVEWKQKKNSQLDGTLRIKADSFHEEWIIEVKREISPIHLPALFELKERYQDLLLVVDRASPQVRKQLKQGGLPYVDTAGNAFLNGRFFVFVDGMKSEKKEERSKPIFTNSGLKVIFLLLLDEALVNAPYRQIAGLARVALGNLPPIVSGLRQRGFLVKLNRQSYKLTKKTALFERWIREYEDRLKPKLFLGRYRFLRGEKIDWRSIPLNRQRSFWGSEPATDILTSYLKPEVLTIYTDETKTDLMQNYRFVPDEAGNISVYKRFWNNYLQPDGIVPPQLIYADLICSGHARNIEAARIIRERNLAYFFG